MKRLFREAPPPQPKALVPPSSPAPSLAASAPAAAVAVAAPAADGGAGISDAVARAMEKVRYCFLRASQGRGGGPQAAVRSGGVSMCLLAISVHPFQVPIGALTSTWIFFYRRASSLILAQAAALEKKDPEPTAPVAATVVGNGTPAQ